MTAHSYVRVWADADGESHFEDVALPTATRLSPTGVVAAVSAPLDVAALCFREVVEEASGVEPHTAPEPLLIVHLEGWAEVEVSDGETRQFGPGSVVLVEDTTGRGHVTRRVGQGPRRTLIGAVARADQATGPPIREEQMDR